MHHPKTILVTGGTGTLGRLVVPRLRAAGCDVRVLSRRARQDGGPTTSVDSADGADGVDHLVGDLTTGDGVDAATDGAEVVVHCAGTSKGDDVKAHRLVQAAGRSGVRHLVFISVVGADRVPMAGRLDRAMFGYFGAKLAAERIVADAGVPWTTLRATQFHDLTLTTVRAMSRLPVVPVPSGFRFQPVETGEVADRLVELALGAPAGLVPDLAGPRAYPMADLLRSYLRASGKHRLVVPVRMPGRAARAFRDGANLALDRAVGTRTWEEFLAEHVVRRGTPVSSASGSSTSASSPARLG